MSKVIYLASPYSHELAWIRGIREALVSAAGSELISRGYRVIGPITESRGYEPYLPENITHTFEFWEAIDLHHVRHCDEVHVLCLKGWARSTGVTAEIEYAQSLGIPIVYHEPRDLLSNYDEYLK